MKYLFCKMRYSLGLWATLPKALLPEKAPSSVVWTSPLGPINPGPTSRPTFHSTKCSLLGKRETRAVPTRGTYFYVRNNKKDQIFFLVSFLSPSPGKREVGYSYQLLHTKKEDAKLPKMPPMNSCLQRQNLCVQSNSFKIKRITKVKNETNNL